MTKATTITVYTQPPGHYTLDKNEEPTCHVITYDQLTCEEKYIPNIDKDDLLFIKKLSDKNDKVTWLHFRHFKQKRLLDSLKEIYQFHSLTMEDIANGGQRSKHECFLTYDALFMQVVSVQDEIKSKQLSILFNSNTVISFSEDDSMIDHVVKTITDRIKDSKGRIRKKKADYLTYCLADSVVDTYFNLLEKMEEKIEALDTSTGMMDTRVTVHDIGPVLLKQVHMMKKNMASIKKTIWPLREMANSMQRGESKFIQEDNFVFVRDLYDHTVRIAESTEGLRDVTNGLIELYMSATGMKMNQAMKVLTVISTIFVPITFITSVYGMNFDGIDELHFPHAYFIVWGIMLTIAITLLLWFKKKKWL